MTLRFEQWWDVVTGRRPSPGGGSVTEGCRGEDGPPRSTRGRRIERRECVLGSPSTGLLVAVLLVGAMVTSGCERREIGSGEQASTPSTREVVFEDEFQRQSLGDDWVRGTGDEGGTGDWRIEDGWVAGENLHNDPLWLDRKLPKDVRIEFEARALSSEGDIKVEVFGDGRSHQSGYLLIHGGWNNTKDKIARLDEHGDDAKERPTRGVEKGETYQFAIERTDGTLRWYRDGELFMTYDDPNPLRGPEHRYFAFSNWEAPVQFDDVRIYRVE